MDWSRYTHLIIVGGGNTSLSDRATDRVNQWIREDGGILVTMRQASRMAQSAFLGMDTEDDASRDDDDTPNERRNYADMGVDDAEHFIGGAIFQTDLDPSNPIGFGYADRDLPVHRNTSFTLQRPENNPFAVVAEYTDDPLLSGYASQRRQDEIAGTPAIIAQRHGRGAVIMFADNPAFRATFRGTERAFMNAVFFGGLIDRPFGDYEEE